MAWGLMEMPQITQLENQFYDWLKYRRNINPVSLEDYQRILKVFKNNLGDLDMKKITEHTIWDWRKMMEDKKLLSKTQYDYIMAIRVFLKFCQEKGILKFDANVIKLPRVEKKEVVYLQNGEVKQLLDVIKNLKHRAIVEVLLSTGLRVGELISLTKDNIIDGEIKVMGKGNKERIVYLNKRASKWLKKYLKTRKDNSPLVFISTKGNKITSHAIEDMFRVARKKTGIKKQITPHTCRHTVGTNMSMNGADITFIKDYLGHEDIRVTDRFYRGKDKSKLKEVVHRYINYDN